MRQTQRTRAASSTALWALARKEAATSTAPAQGAANSTAPGPHEPTDTQEWLPAQLLGHTPQTCPRTHTGAATSSAPGSWPPSTRAHAQKPHKPRLGTRHKCNLSHTATHCKQHAALPETHDMWYKHRAQKVPRRKNPRNKCASVDPRSSANTCAPDPRDPTKRRERLGSLTQFLRALRRLCGHTAEKYRLAHMGPAPGTPNVVVPVPSMGHRHVWVRHRWTQLRGSNGSYGSARSPWSRRPLGDPLQRLAASSQLSSSDELKEELDVSLSVSVSESPFAHIFQAPTPGGGWQGAGGAG